ncbi:predicted protein [Nematostella vectensis]|uniref:Glutaredoxin n=1 Tax=Nematostella vectensis TaxID=45351 RepID=A7SR09_NEMVE|nr:predicted protein [Nematostella vectensis]|eukprot:XP_001625978.1 predicted protein [Nematostella vectensis]
MKGRVTIFSITGCPFCVRAKTKLRDELNLEFVDINLDRHPERRQEAMERSGKRTVPQIFFNNIHVGGFDDLDKLSADKMEELIKEIKEHSPPPEAPQPPPPEPSEDTGSPNADDDLRHLILQLYNKHLSPDGKGVDYTAMGQSTQFQDYVKHTAELQRVNLETASREEKLAFFINIYNALVIHATVTKGPPVNLWQRYKFFNTVSYIIGGHVYCLNDIENGVLRSNRRAIGAIRRPFSKKDPRLKIALDQPEPKVHFALVCGAKSCPPIKTYSAKGVDEELNVAAEAFLEGEDGCRINMIKREIRLSKIFQWYKEDFGSSNAEVARFVSRHMAEGEKKSQLDELLHRKDFKVSYMPYNWALNSK